MGQEDPDNLAQTVVTRSGHRLQVLSLGRNRGIQMMVEGPGDSVQMDPDEAKELGDLLAARARREMEKPATARVMIEATVKLEPGKRPSDAAGELVLAARSHFGGALKGEQSQSQYD